MRHIIYYTHSLLKRADINFVRIIDTHKNMINETASMITYRRISINYLF